MQYDQTQLQLDLIAIAAEWGARKPHGFFTHSVYDDGCVRIEDCYVAEPNLYVNAVKVDLAQVNTEHNIGSWILSRMVQLEDQRNSTLIDRQLNTHVKNDQMHS
jgi:hypothetical protein